MAKSNKKTVQSTPPSVDASQHAVMWRAINAGLALALIYRSHVIVVDVADPDWWLWWPGYMMGALMCGAVAFCPRVVDSYLWRYLAALIIVLGTNYLVLTAWVVRDVAGAYIDDPTTLMEGRECGYLAFIICWAVICRMTGSQKVGIMSVVRLLLFSGILLCCVPVLVWSMCFYSSGLSKIPYCRGLFVTADSD